MTIFLTKIYGNFGAILDVNCPFNRIILRAEKALRVRSQKNSIFSTFLEHFFGVINHSLMASYTLGHSLCILEASWKLLDHFWETSKIHDFRLFLVSWKNLSGLRNFSKTIESTQRMHSWMALDVSYAGKLIAPESIQLTDFEISSFFWPIYQTCMRAVNRQPGFRAGGL